MKIYTLKDLECKDGMYYVGRLVDLDGNDWVDKDFAIKLLDVINGEMNQSI